MDSTVPLKPATRSLRGRTRAAYVTARDLRQWS
jgi:hypothetical protein